MTELQEINRKLDLIIKSLGLDGGKTHGDIVHLASKKIEELRSRQLTKDKKKSKLEVCQ